MPSWRGKPATPKGPVLPCAHAIDGAMTVLLRQSIWLCRRLNGIGDEGAKTLLEAAGVSKTIQALNLSTTEMREQVSPLCTVNLDVFA